MSRQSATLAVLIAVTLLLSVTPLHVLGRDVAILVALGAGASWVRFKLAPVGYLSLTSFVFFLALLTIGPILAVAVLLISTSFNVLAFGRQPQRVVTFELSEELIAGLASLLAWNAVHVGDPLRYLSSVSAYTAAKLMLEGIYGVTRQGVTLRAFAKGTGMDFLANFLLFGFLALAITAYLSKNYGYLAMTLTTIALAELYHPWKLLSDQDDILFANLSMVAQAVDAKDPYTAKHSRNVSSIATRLARALGLPEAEVRKIRIGALMHDIGKIGVSGSIIRKPTKLDAGEASAMRAHPEISASIMRPIELLADAADIVKHHHEHFDGTGYPDGLRGEAIPLASRVILVADAFDAMTTDRPYRNGLSREAALRVLREHAGRQFDARVVAALESLVIGV